MGDEKLTVAVTPVNNESKVEHVRRLLSKLFELGIKVKILLLGSGYYTVDIINYLNAKGINKAIRRMFRKRFAIETSYRMINQFLPKTTSKLYSLRKLYFYLAVLLYNIWVFMNYKREKVTVQYVKFLLMVEALISNMYVTIFR
ncbi:MAG: hypothetical protein GU362_05440 [Thaumarchaeota archaeon]|jgi:IS4 transposase|nr:hypothetical protein [Nitrososphaerota archaeon]